MADKTQLNASYEHFGDIVFAAGFAEASGNFLELVTQTAIGVATGISRGTDGTYGEYVALDIDSTDNVNFGDNAAWDGLTACTVVALVKNNQNNTADAQGIVTKEGAGTADAFQVNWNSNENLDASVSISGAFVTASLTDGLDNGSVGALATNWNVVGFTWDGANIVARVNALKSSAVAAVGTMGVSTHNLLIGARTSDANDPWDGQIAMVAILDVALDDTDWNALVSDPLQIFAADGGTPINVDVGLVSETDSAFAVGRLKSRTLGLNTETDTALNVTASRRVAVGLATETDSAFSVGRLKSILLGLALEVDSALSAATQSVVGFADAAWRILFRRR